VKRELLPSYTRKLKKVMGRKRNPIRARRTSVNLRPILEVVGTSLVELFYARREIKERGQKKKKNAEGKNAAQHRLRR